MTATGADTYSDFVKTLLDAEAARKTSIEAKGSAVITTSGTLVTLLFGLVAVITSRATFKLPLSAHGWLMAAVISFVVAVAAAILVSVPLPYGQTSITVEDLQDWWNDSLPDAEAAVAGARLLGLTAARRMNSLKVLVLGIALLAEFVALAMLTVAVWHIIGS